MIAIITKSKLPKYKYTVVIDGKTIHFGASGYSDYTIHKDEARRQRYIALHQKNEDFNKSGLYTSGIWAKHLLWNLPTLEQSIRDVNKRFNINVKLI
jgi:hypothetical protein